MLKSASRLMTPFTASLLAPAVPVIPLLRRNFGRSHAPFDHLLAVMLIRRGRNQEPAELAHVPPKQLDSVFAALADPTRGRFWSGCWPAARWRWARSPRPST